MEAGGLPQERRSFLLPYSPKCVEGEISEVEHFRFTAFYEVRIRVGLLLYHRFRWPS
jgi:hypothetical protein